MHGLFGRKMFMCPPLHFSNGCKLTIFFETPFELFMACEYHFFAEVTSNTAARLGVYYAC